jgi:hypothetical protein
MVERWVPRSASSTSTRSVSPRKISFATGSNARPTGVPGGMGANAVCWPVSRSTVAKPAFAYKPPPASGAVRATKARFLGASTTIPADPPWIGPIAARKALDVPAAGAAQLEPGGSPDETSPTTVPPQQSVERARATQAKGRSMGPPRDRSRPGR